MLATAIKIKQASDSILSSRPYIEVSRQEVTDGLVDLINEQTQGESRAHFDVTYKGIGFAQHATGEMIRKTTFYPSSNDETQGEYVDEMWVYIDKWETYDSDGRMVRSNSNMRWLESLVLKSIHN